MCRVLIAWSNLSWILQAFFCAAFTDITMFSQASVSVSHISGIKGHKAGRHSPQLKLRSRSSPRRSGRPVRNTWCWPSSPNWSPVIHTKGNFYRSFLLHKEDYRLLDVKLKIIPFKIRGLCSVFLSHKNFKWSFFKRKVLGKTDFMPCALNFNSFVE